MKVGVTLAFIFFYTGAFAQEKKDTITDKGRDLPNALLWEISGNGLKESSYLFGTIHVICKDEINIPALMKEKLALSKKIYFENAYTAAPYREWANNKHIKELVSKRYFKAINKILLKKYPDLPDSALMYHLPPEFLLRRLFALKSTCFITSYERAIGLIAKANNTTIESLESTQEHLLPFKETDIETQLKTLKSFLDNPDVEMEKYKKNIEIYNYHNIVDMAPLGRDTISENRFVTKRNLLWLPRIEAAMKDGPVFFAVGAGHLGGDAGLIWLLADKGYFLKPLF